MIMQYYRSGHGFLIVYSVTDSSSLQDAREKYQDILEETVKWLNFIQKIDILDQKKLKRKFVKSTCNILHDTGDNPRNMQACHVNW